MKLQKIALWPLSMLYSSVMSIRNLLFEVNVLKSHQFDIPVITVGNLTVGGTGKTPHIEYLVKLLIDSHKVAVLSRGYKRQSSGFRIASANDTANNVGDEPLQIKKKFPTACVAVDANRVEGINKIIEYKQHTEVVLLDDAYQHRYVKAGKNILLTDYNRLFYNDSVLPSGRLRECASGKKRADIIIVTKVPPNIEEQKMESIKKNIAPLPHQKIFFTSVKYGNFRPAIASEAKENRADNIFNTKKISVLLVTGIAQPKPVYEYIKIVTNNIKHLRFPDHHNFTAKDISKITDEYAALKTNSSLTPVVVTTEKDAVRLVDILNNEDGQELLAHIYYLPIEVAFHGKTGSEFDKIINNYVTKNRRNSKLS